jgi:hypothetical protein
VRIDFSATEAPPFCNPRLTAVIDFLYDEYISDHLRNVGVVFRQQRPHESVRKPDYFDAISHANWLSETIFGLQWRIP